MSEIVQFTSMFPLISKHHVTLTMINLKTIFVVSIIHQTHYRTEQSTHWFLRYDFLPDLANYGY